MLYVTTMDEKKGTVDSNELKCRRFFMTSRERVIAALQYKPVDKVPLQYYYAPDRCIM